MTRWLRGKRGGLAAFLAIAALVVGGLGWATSAALRLEAERIEARAHAQAETERYDKLGLALWSLDSWMSHVFGREESRPSNHYSAVYALSLTLQNNGNLYPPGSVLELSPLLTTELPDWMLLHFQADAESGWGSPQVLSPTLRQRLEIARSRGALVNVTSEREQFLAELSRDLPVAQLLTHPQLAGAQPTFRDNILGWAKQNILNPEQANSLSAASGTQQPQSAMQSQAQSQYLLQDVTKRAAQNYGGQRKDENANVNAKEQSAPKEQKDDDPQLAFTNTVRNGEGWFSLDQLQKKGGAPSSITLSSMLPLWLTTTGGRELLIVARLVRLDDRTICQGIVLDWPRLRTLLADEVGSLFPDARIEPVRGSVPPHPERTMTALPLELDPGQLPFEIPEAGWTPLRIGLTLAWAAALVALAAVGLGGWSLLDLSERRIRFVSAVTHELRTPLTTLRLYLDMLTGGLVKEAKQKDEYLQTLNTEAERLNRLIGNVLDFSRLENQKPRLTVGTVAVAELLEQVRSTWQGRCHDAGKELIVENAVGEEALLSTDLSLVQQILANLIDNACKYSREAKDQRIWLRAYLSKATRLVLEVQDQGPGIALRERRSVFRPFRRGREADVTAGGVGLGLALAQRWAVLLGGRLTLTCGPERTGACFRLELPFTQVRSV